MAPESAEAQDHAVDRQKGLRLASRLEASHLTLSLSCRLMRDFSPIVLGSGRAVIHGRHRHAVSGTVGTFLAGVLGTMVQVSVGHVAE